MTMRIYFFPKWLLQVVLIGVCSLLAGGLLWLLFQGGETTVMAEPISQGNTERKQVAITINVDWGEEVLPKMLQTLKAHQTKATFFITGRFAEKYPELVRQIAADGHEIGNHGYKHPHPDLLSTEQNIADIRKGEQILKKLTGTRPNLYAPPYGEHGATCLAAAEQCEDTTILWTLDTVDWEDPIPSHDTLVERVAGDRLSNGAILLMHPKEHTAEALGDILRTIQSKGYTCVSVSELL